MYNLLTCKMNVQIESEFDGDTNTQLIHLQQTFDLWEFIGYFTGEYLDACTLVGKFDTEYHLIRAKTSVSSSIFLDAYRIICANYRIVAAQQDMPLIYEDHIYLSLLESNWKDYYHDEVRSLARDPHINQTIIFMLVRDGDDVVTRVKPILSRLLAERYHTCNSKFISSCPQFQKCLGSKEFYIKEWPYKF